MSRESIWSGHVIQWCGIGLVAAALAGCGVVSSGSAAAPRPASPAGSSPAPAPAAHGSTGGHAPTGSGTTSSTRAASAHTGSPKMISGVRAAATAFDQVYYARRFAVSWELLDPIAKRRIPQHVWVQVHQGCPSDRAGLSRAIGAVTVFGKVAIVTEALASASSDRGTHQVFNYAKGRWGYAPQDPSIYHHSSIVADIAAARAAGLCNSWKDY